MVKLGILDYAQLDEGETAFDALQNSVSLAQHAEKLGYDRFWVAEHHNVPAFLSSSPEVLMMHLLDQTERIRIGSGGVMLPHYAPLKVAENFMMLEGFHPGRVDLGIGNTKGTRGVREALNENKLDFLPYEASIQDLQKFLSDTLPSDHRHFEVKAKPNITSVPQMWALSTSIEGAKMAGRRGMGYCFGFFPYANRHALETAQVACQMYRETFVPSPFMEQPCVSLAVFLCVGHDQEEAEALGKALDLWLLGIDNFGAFQAFPSVETARNYPYTSRQSEQIQVNRSRMLVGTVEQVYEKLRTRIKITAADELLLIPLMPGIQNRTNALSWLIEAFK